MDFSLGIRNELRKYFHLREEDRLGYEDRMLSIFNRMTGSLDSFFINEYEIAEESYFCNPEDSDARAGFDKLNDILYGRWLAASYGEDGLEEVIRGTIREFRDLYYSNSVGNVRGFDAFRMLKADPGDYSGLADRLSMRFFDAYCAAKEGRARTARTILSELESYSIPVEAFADDYFREIWKRIEKEKRKLSVSLALDA